MKSRSQGRAKAVLTALAAGAGALYFFDRAEGASRRANLRRMVDGAMKKGGRMLRTLASISDAKAEPAASIDDALLIHRIRSAIGEVVPNAEAIGIAAVNGAVTVDGPVLVDDLPGLLRAIRSVPGVRSIQDELEVHELPDQTDLARGHERLADRE